MMKMYAAAMAAGRRDHDSGTLVSGCSATIVIARSEAEAIGLTYKQAHESYPVKDGWGAHSFTVMLVTEEMMNQVGYYKPDATAAG